MENKEEKQFLKIPYDILENKELNAGQKITLALVYSFYNNKKEMYMSYTKIALRTGVSRTTAVDRINSLRDMGYIETKDIDNRKRIIIPLRMVEISTKVVDVPTKVVDIPTKVVDIPTSDSRHTDQEVVDVVGAIIYPILDKSLEKPLHTVLDTVLYNENSTEHQNAGENQLEKQLIEMFPMFEKNELLHLLARNNMQRIDEVLYNSENTINKMDAWNLIHQYQLNK